LSANYETFAVGWGFAPDLMNREAYNISPDSLFRQMLIAPAPEKVPYTYAQHAGEGAYLTFSPSI